VHAHAVTGLEGRHAAQLSALETFNH